MMRLLNWKLLHMQLLKAMLTLVAYPTRKCGSGFSALLPARLTLSRRKLGSFDR